MTRPLFSRLDRRVLPSIGVWLCALIGLPIAVGNDPPPAPPAPPEAVLAAEQARIDAIDASLRTALCVFGPDGKGGGSGVVITADGYALTNFHVAQPCGNHLSCGMADGRVYDAVIVGLDPTGDVALIKLLGRTDFPVAAMADSDTVRAGDWCFAVGNPFLLATDLQPTVSYGIVSGIHRYQYPAGTLLEYADCIQTDAAINPGNSGGPLFNSAGQLIGINGRGSFEKRGRVNVGVGYAISSNQIKNFLGHLKSGRIVDHATLGATVSTNDRGQVIVSNILATSDAFRRGLRYGDEILSFGGRHITTVNGLKNAMGIYPRGWRVPLSFQRAGEQLDVHVRLAGVHSQEELLASVERPIAPEDPKPGAPKPDAPKPDAPKPGEPKPDGQPPEGRKPGEPPRDGPDRRSPHGAPPKARPMPAEVASQLEVRRGYANYYFNRLNRDRVWSLFASHGSFDAIPSHWSMLGEVAGSKVELDLTDTVAFGRFPDGPARVDVTSDLGNQLQPIGSGGLLVALHLWKRLLLLGPEKFGQVYYLGTAPLAARTGLFEVLVATHDVIECHFYFEPDSGRLVAMEMTPEADADACEVYFDDYRMLDGREFPHLIQVFYSDQTFAEIRVTEFKSSADPGPSPGAPAKKEDGSGS